MGRREIHVDFGNEQSSYERNQSYRPERKYGGCGVATKPDAYAGPPFWHVQAHVHGRLRKFLVVRLEYSPTGSGHGAFRIDEIMKDRTTTHGYTCSWPTTEDCVRVAMFNR